METIARLTPYDLLLIPQRESYHEWHFLAYIGAAIVWFLFSGCLIRYSNSRMIRRFAWGVSGGSLSGFQNFIKDSLTILKASNNADTTDSLPIGLFVSLVFLAGFAAFGGLLVLTACMKRYDATYSSAMFVGSFVISASLMSLVHYDTITNLDGTVNLILYPTGLAILMAGVALLLKSTEPETRNSPTVSRNPSETRIHTMVRLVYEQTFCSRNSNDASDRSHAICIQ